MLFYYFIMPWSWCYGPNFYLVFHLWCIRTIAYQFIHRMVWVRVIYFQSLHLNGLGLLHSQVGNVSHPHYWKIFDIVKLFQMANSKAMMMTISINGMRNTCLTIANDLLLYHRHQYQYSASSMIVWAFYQIFRKLVWYQFFLVSSTTSIYDHENKNITNLTFYM